MKNENQEIQIIDPDSVQVVQSITREEVDIQITTAKRYPRSIKAFQQDALSQATIDEDVAASCFYVLPRAGKKIEGPSVRLAEIIASSWQHLRAGSRFIGESEDRKFVICEGFAWDLQTNTQFSVREVRRITDKHGKRYNDDMVQTTIRACSSIAFRNALFKVVPMAYTKLIYEKAKEVAIGDASSLSNRRQKMVDHFSKFGVTLDRILAVVEKPSLENIDLSDMETLFGLSTSIKEGDIDIDAAFPPLVKDVSAPSTLAGKVAAKAAAAKEERPKRGEQQEELPKLSKEELDALNREPGSEG